MSRNAFYSSQLYGEIINSYFFLSAVGVINDVRHVPESTHSTQAPHGTRKEMGTASVFGIITVSIGQDAVLQGKAFA